MAPEEPFLQLSLWMGNFCVKSYTFCLYFILNLPGGSGSTKLLNMDPQHWFYNILGCTIFFIFRNIIIIKKRMVFLSCTNLGFLSLATISCREWAPITFVPFAWNCFSKKKYCAPLYGSAEGSSCSTAVELTPLNREVRGFNYFYPQYCVLLQVPLGGAAWLIFL